MEAVELSAAEIETLRNALSHNSTAQEIADARNILDRLFPPAPEVDEATVWTRKVLHAEYQITPYATGEMDGRAQFINARQVLSELIASKDAEIERLKKLSDGLRTYMYDKDASRREWVVKKYKAAERNTAEPVFTDTPSILAERALGQVPAPDTAPVVEVTQDDIEAAKESIFYECGNQHVKADIQMSYARHRTEAEARGRRAALENIELIPQRVKAMIGANDERSNIALGYCEAELRSFKRLMTEGK